MDFIFATIIPNLTYLARARLISLQGVAGEA